MPIRRSGAARRFSTWLRPADSRAIGRSASTLPRSGTRSRLRSPDQEATVMESERAPAIGGGRDAGDPGDPCIMVILGASGDLTKRKLIPALYNLAKEHLLSREFALIGFARPDWTHEQFRDKCTEDVKQFATAAIDPDVWHWFARRMFYVSGEFSDPAAFAKLKDLLGEVNASHGTRGNYLYYLAAAPQFFAECITRLGEAGLAAEEDGQWRRVIVEKPFGRDFDSAH